jgi:hypothetical protein
MGSCGGWHFGSLLKAGGMTRILRLNLMGIAFSVFPDLLDEACPNRL